MLGQVSLRADSPLSHAREAKNEAIWCEGMWSRVECGVTVGSQAASQLDSAHAATRLVFQPECARRLGQADVLMI